MGFYIKGGKNMEGTVTISLEDFYYLRRCEEKTNYIEDLIKPVLDEHGEVSQAESVRIVDRIIGKIFI